MRFATWAAVSSKEQAAEDKFSLESQAKRTAAEGLRRGWVQSAGPYTVPGQSREIYIDLADAEREIPALRQMLADARAGKFDILIMTELDRLRSLQMQVFRYLARCRVQILALNAPIEPVDPADYNQHKADAVLMLITISQASSSLEISRLRRKYDDGMPKRVTELGIPPIGIPYGYRKPLGLDPDIKAIRTAVPEQDPALVPHILEMRDLLLSGQSSRQIASHLNKKGLPAPRGGLWTPVSVLGVLRNPFYAGKVSWGFSESKLDADNKRKRTRSLVPREQAVGRHVPLWDDATHEAILAEIDRRKRSYLGRRNNQLTGLLRCGECGAPLWRQGNGPRDTDRLIWRCSRTGSAVGHVNVPHSELLPVIAAALADRLQSALDASPASTPSRKPPADPIADLRKQLDRLETGYLEGAFDLDRYRARKSELDRKLVAARDAAHQAEVQARERAAWLTSARALSTLDDLPAWITTADPAAVNHALRLLLERITVSEHGIEITFR